MKRYCFSLTLAKNCLDFGGKHNINGQKKTLTYSGNNNFRTSSEPLIIGLTSHYAKSAPWIGKIDEFRIYNRALSEAEIQELYQEATNVSPNAVKLEVQIDNTDKHVGKEFSVTITAVGADGNIDRSFNQYVTLRSSTDSNSASSVKLSDGKWSGQFKVLYGGTGIYLHAKSGALSGQSNAFNVIGNVSTLSNIGGSIVDSYKQKVTEQVKVEIGDVASDVFSGGTYQFEGVPGGKSYTCKLTHLSSGKTSFTSPIFIPQGQSIVKDLQIILQADKAKTPVLLLAGIMGSATLTDGGRFPSLPAAQGQTGENVLKLHNPVNAVGWKTLEKAIQTAGYLYFEVPYDWRMDIRDIVDTYLIPAIDRVKELGYTKVNIVAHSMGGLVVRSYIQGDKYPQRQDIERFAMVGTPNAGSCNAYYMWEGGEPKLVDDLTYSVVANNFYFDTTAENYKATFGKTIKSNDYTGIWKYYVGKVNKVQPPLTAVKHLLPTYKFLGADESNERLLTVEKNDFLYELNEGKYFLNALLRMGSQYDNSGKIKTIIFAGDGQDTIRRITDGFTCGIELYKDGNPEPRHSTRSAVMLTGRGSGDGTVLLNESALFPYNKGWASKQVGEGEHAELVKVFSNEIVKFIKGDPVFETKTKSKTVRTEEEESSSYLAFSFSGRAQGYLTDSSGVGIGINPQTNLLENNFTDGEVIFLSDSGSISVNNSVNGTYKLDITSIYEEDYNLNISYAGSEINASIDLHGFNYAGMQSIYITLDSFAANPITVTMNPAVPTGFTANIAAGAAGQSITRLAWSSSTDTSVKSYKVYGKPADDTYFSYLGSSTEASYLTTNAWAGNEETPVWQYAVSAVKQDGTESFLSEIVENNDQDHDGLTDAEEIEGGSLVNNPDSDGDGLNDSKEYGLSTNPVKADTDGDTYSDYAEIQAQSDPLDSSSVPTTQTQTYKVLTDSSPSLSISSGENIKVYGSSGVNTLNISSGATVECINFVVANVINLVDDSASDFTVHRSGAMVYFESSAKGTTIKIPATKTTQTINFNGGVSYNLVISNGKVMLNTQEVTLVKVQL
ncbi:MAG: LamG-like jellyroll fold domain-containing protein [Desulfamplus sp.]